METLTFRLGSAVVDPDSRTLSSVRAGNCLLQPKYMEVLHLLAEYHPDVVSRDFLIERVWDGNPFVGAKALTNAIWHLRSALSQVDDGVEWIETLRKGGYRLKVRPEPIARKPLKPLQAHRRLSRLLRAVVVMATVIGLGLSYLFWQLLYAEHPPAPGVVQALTRNPGRELYPAPSPDGRYLAYYWVPYDQAGALYLQDLTQPDLPPRKLTDGADVDGRAFWGPQGRSLLYARRGKGYCRIVRHQLATNAVTPLVDCAVNTAIGLDTTPDGRYLAYLGDNALGKRQIHLLALEDGTAPRPVPCAEDACVMADRDVAIADDGQRLLISRRATHSQEVIFLHHLDSGEEQQLTFAHEDVRGMEWLDPRRAVFASQRSRIRRGFLLDVESGERRPLPVTGFSYPRREPAEGQLLYHSWNDSHYISVLNRGELNHSEPYLFSQASHKDPDYHPSSGRLAYVSNQSGFDEIWVQGVKGERRQLTRMESQLRHPAWSHDGQSLAFLGPGPQGNLLHVLTLDSGRIRTVNTPFQDHAKPSWSLDDRALIGSVISERDRRLAWMPLEGPPRILTRQPGRYAVMVSADTLLFSEGSAGGNGRLYRLTLNEPERAPTLMLDEAQFGLPHTWAVSGTSLFFWRRGHDFLELRQRDMATGETQALIRQTPGVLERYAHVVPLGDGRVLMTQTRQAEVDIYRLRVPGRH